MVLGILLSSLLSLPLYSWVLSLVASLTCGWLCYSIQKHKLAFTFILLSTFLLGASLYTSAHINFENNSLRKLEFTSYADFTGKLYKSPSRGQDRDVLFIRVEKVFYQNTEHKIRGNLRVSVPHSSEFALPEDLFVHDRVKVSARLLPLHGFRNFKSYSLTAYLKSQNIHNRASTKTPLLVERSEPGKNYSPLRLVSILRQKLLEKIETHFPASDAERSLSPQGAVLEALLLGERNRMDPGVTESLQRSGIYHLFAISGAHIAIISFFLFSLFKLFRAPNRLSYLLVMVFLLFYVFLVEGRPSVFRATIMTLCFLLGKLLWRNVNLINTISISVFILLFLNPFSLFNVGFQLTFSATLAIILFFPRIIKYFPKLPLRISEILALSLTAQLGVLPFVAGSFNRITFSALILNFAALPLVALIMAAGHIFLPLAFLSTLLSRWLTQGIEFLIDLLISSSHLLDGFSFISYRIPTPHLFTLIGYFLFLYLLLLPPKIKKQRIVLGLCFLAFCVILITHPFPPRSKNLKLTFIDVGQGESTLVEFPGKRKMLIDGGGFPVGTFDVGENVVSSFLWKKGIKKIDYLVLTHAHPDHLIGLKAVSQNFKIREFWEAFSPSESKDYDELKKMLPKSTVTKRLFRGASHQEGRVKIKVLHPEQKEFTVSRIRNDDSLVLRITSGQISFLLPGDIGIPVEKDILEAFPGIRSQVLKSPHHGSRTSSSEDFLRIISPRIVVISVGAGNVYGFPDKEVLERYERIGAKVYRTDIHGAVEITLKDQDISVRTASSEPQK
ncbi:MAG: DNA internalization-related competence protein ComEC/Rec2 [Candidatus Aminicenantes bacterium]